jgi:hypothetical protein
MIATDAISWIVLECVKINEEDTTSSSRIFIKIMMQEMMESMGLKALAERFKDEQVKHATKDMFPMDNPKNTRFSINYFTSIGLGILTEEMREYLKVCQVYTFEALKWLILFGNRTPHASLWNSDVQCWSKNRIHLVVTPIHLILTLILSPTLTRTLPHRILNLLWTRGDVDEPLLLLAEGGMTHVLCHAVVCQTTLVVPLHAVMSGTTRVLHPHGVGPEMTHALHPRPHVVVPETTLVRLLHAEAGATPHVRRPRRLPRDKGMDEAIPVATHLATGEMTDPLRLASGIWMDGIEVGGMDGMVDMNGGARMTIVRESGMSDLLEVIGVGGSLMRGRETMVAGDNSLVEVGCVVPTCTHAVWYLFAC